MRESAGDELRLKQIRPINIMHTHKIHFTTLMLKCIIDSHNISLMFLAAVKLCSCILCVELFETRYFWVHYYYFASAVVVTKFSQLTAVYYYCVLLYILCCMYFGIFYYFILPVFLSVCISCLCVYGSRCLSQIKCNVM